MQYVRRVRGAFSHFPAFANLRNGLWYAPDFQGTCYFKSTDGHVGAWNFPSTRLNLQVARAAASAGGVLIIDSTRRGKTYPDALTFTVPLWCAVINSVMGLCGDASPCVLPPWVPPSLCHAASASVSAWVKDLGRTADVIREALAGLDRPLVPVWTCQDDAEPPLHASSMPDAIPVICVSASINLDQEDLAALRETQSWCYVQGAGDDEENWARGLTATQFWKHAEELLAAADDGPECVDAYVKALAHLVIVFAGGNAWPLAILSRRLVARIVASTAPTSATTSTETPPCRQYLHTFTMRVSGRSCELRLCSSNALHSAAADVLFVIDTREPSESLGATAMHVPVHAKKRVDGRHYWRDVVLPACVAQARLWVHHCANISSSCADAESSAMPTPMLAIVCDDDPAVAATIAIAIACALFDTSLCVLPWALYDRGDADVSTRTAAAAIAVGKLPVIDKDDIRRMVAVLQAVCGGSGGGHTLPQVPRRLLKQVNEYFMDADSPWRCGLSG